MKIQRAYGTATSTGKGLFVAGNLRFHDHSWDWTQNCLSDPGSKIPAIQPSVIQPFAGGREAAFPVASVCLTVAVPVPSA
jgi:hypothetical protein